MNLRFLTFIKVWTQWVERANVKTFWHYLLCTQPTAFILRWMSEKKRNLFFKYPGTQNKITKLSRQSTLKLVACLLVLWESITNVTEVFYYLILWYSESYLQDTLKSCQIMIRPNFTDDINISPHIITRTMSVNWIEIADQECQKFNIVRARWLWAEKLVKSKYTHTNPNVPFMRSKQTV